VKWDRLAGGASLAVVQQFVGQFVDDDRELVGRHQPRLDADPPAA